MFLLDEHISLILRIDLINTKILFKKVGHVFSVYTSKPTLFN